jgi:hypothetical protein
VLYGLRHAFGTRAVLRGVDVKTLAELMGHTTTRMTEHYLHLAGERSYLAAAMERINAPSTRYGELSRAELESTLSKGTLPPIRWRESFPLALGR